MGKRKTPAQLADEELRYEAAARASTAEEFELLSRDANQAIRADAARNPNADAEALARFAKDPFWGVRIEVAHHPNATRDILLGMIERDPKRRGVVHHAALERLTADGVKVDIDQPK